MNATLDTLRLFWPSFVASLVVALACSLIGVHVVARRLVVVGVALPQIAALGIALSFLCVDWPIFGNHDAAALLLVTAGVAVLAVGARRSWLGQDALAGVLFVGAASATILIVQQSAAGIDEIRHLVEGNVLAIHAPDLPGLAAALLPVLLLHTLALRPMLLVTFDRETAATLGVRTGLWDALFFASLALVAATGVHATGTLFVFGFLVLPAATGLVLGRSTATVFGTSAAAAVASATAGFVFSCDQDTPTGPTCTLAALVVFLGALGLNSLRRRRRPG
ncbi:MAG: metal ABC transporter permease [Planctomycetes bacterium]|nr:metal ABC transporter permease [Planctomycetota bacterium]